jgi:hypothetical protein
MTKRMKKAGTYIVIFFLLLSTSGLSITRHYCGQSFASFSLFSTPKPCCGDDCDKCHNEFSFNKVTDNYTASSSEEVKSPVSDYAFQAFFINELLESLTAFSSGAPIIHRKFLMRKTGDIPVSSGNFRC